MNETDSFLERDYMIDKEGRDAYGKTVTLISKLNGSWVLYTV